MFVPNVDLLVNIRAPFADWMYSHDYIDSDMLILGLEAKQEIDVYCSSAY